MRNAKVEPSSSVWEQLRNVRLLAMDVDGVLTDGAVNYDSEGRELKSFHVADGLGIVLLRRCDIRIVWITGRKSAIVEKRSVELGVDAVLQGVQDKYKALADVCNLMEIPSEAVAYVGDDWNDLPAFNYAGVRIAVANAVEEVKNAADMVTLNSGGRGAIREVCNCILEAQERRQSCLESYLASLKSKKAEEVEEVEGSSLTELFGQ